MQLLIRSVSLLYHSEDLYLISYEDFITPL